MFNIPYKNYKCYTREGKIIYFDDFNDLDLSYLHREDGPAIIQENTGYEVWVIDGFVHCETGPALVWRDTRLIKWYLKDKSYSFEEWCVLLNKSEEEKILLKLTYL